MALRTSTVLCVVATEQGSFEATVEDGQGGATLLRTYKGWGV